MRRIGSILLGLVLMVTSCTEAFNEDFPALQGELKIKLKQDNRTKSTETADEELPETGEFVVEVIETSSGRAFYRKKYADLADQTLHLNEGEHKCYAYYGDPKGVGFSAYHYTAEAYADIRQNEIADVELTATLQNVKVAVNFGPALAFDHKDYYAQVNTQTGRKLTFTKSETRCGYVPVGDITLTLFVYVQDQWLCYTSEPVTCASKDFVTFNLDTQRYVDLTSIEVIIDNGTEEVVREFEVPAVAAPQDAPTLLVNGFQDGQYSLVEATDLVHSGFKADIVAMGGLQNCYLNINSGALELAGLPSRVDLADLAPEQESLLAQFGLKYLPQMYGKRFSYIDFSGLIDYISSSVPYDPAHQTAADISIEVIDIYGKTAVSELYSVLVEKAEATVRFEGYDIWATKMINPVITVTKGDPSKFVLKCVKSSDMLYSSVQTIQPKSVSGKTIKFDGFYGLDAGTTYKIWAVYNNNNNSKTPEIQFNTETALQVGNSSFEEHTYESFTTTKKLIFNMGTEKITWYQLWGNGAEQWWAVNSSVTLDANITPEYVTYKCFPTVSVTSKAKSGSRAVIIASIAIDDYGSEISSGNATAGEVFIGTADNSGELKGNHITDGHSFASRPMSMSFWYMLDSHNSDPFSAEIKILDSNDEVIGSAKKTDVSTSTSSWTQLTMPINYEYTDKKAEKIYISFKSSATGSVNSRKYTSLTRLNPSGSEANAGDIHAGNVLWVDDVRLNY